MKFGETTGTVLRFPGAHAGTAGDSAAGPIDFHHALVAITPAAPADERAGSRPPAAFLTQLIAAKAQLPQSRERRRAEPDEAGRAYQSALAPKAYVGGRNFSRHS